MKLFQRRIVDEEKTLRKRIKSLEQFISENDVFRKLDISERELLANELKNRKSLSAVLRERIERWTDT